LFSSATGGDFDYTEVKQSLKLMAHEFVGRTVPPGASHIVRMYGRIVSTEGEGSEGVAFEQMTDDLTVLTKALPAYTAEAIHRRRLGVVRIVMQTLDGLRFLHSRGAAHLDMKEDNVMYRVLPYRKVLVKLIDFGAMQWKRRDAELLMIQSTDEAAKEGTLEFLSPARLATYKCTDSKDDSCDDVVTFDAQKDDVWAVGLMLLSMLSPGAFAGERRGRELLAPDIDKEDKDAYLKINNKEWGKRVDDAVSPKRARLLQDERSANAEFVKLLRGVLKGMLEPNEAARLTADEAHYELWTVMATAGSYGLQDPVEGLNG
jgi:serine/threonine protein kinase